MSLKMVLLYMVVQALVPYVLQNFGRLECVVAEQSLGYIVAVYLHLMTRLLYHLTRQLAIPRFLLL